MADNFRKTSDVNGFYISKDGNDGTAVQFTGSNDSAAKESPRNTLFDFSASATVNQSVLNVVGSGHYQQNNLSRGSYQADGKVLIDGDGSTNLIPNGANNQTDHAFRLIGFSIRNHSNIFASGRRSAIFLENCILEDVPANGTFGANGNMSCITSVFYPVNLSAGYTVNARQSSSGTVSPFPKLFNNNTFYNVKLRFTFAGSASVDIFDSVACLNDQGGVCFEAVGQSSGLTSVTNSAFKGQISLFGTTYTSFSDPQLAIDHPDFVNNQGNFEVTQDLSECFNNVERRDLSLKITSQLIKPDRTVGGTVFRFAKYVDVDIELSPPNLIADPAASATGFRFREVTPGNNSVVLTSDAFLVDPINGGISIIDTVDLINELNFDANLAQDQPKNQNVPAVENFLTGTDGGNPKRLTFEFRTSRNPPTTKPTTNAEWDNSFNGVSPGTYIKHEFNSEKLVVDNTGTGKGDDDFNVSIDEREFVAVWMQIRVTLRRDFDL